MATLLAKLLLTPHFSPNVKIPNFMNLTNEKYLHLINSTHELIVVILDGNVVFYNNQVSALFGYSDSELQNIPFIKFVAPASRKKVMGFYMPHTMGDMTLHRYEIQAMAKNGKVRDMDINTSLTSYEGKPAILVIMRDITQQNNENRITAARLSLLEHSYSLSFKDLVKKMLEELEQLTGSNISFFHFVNEDENKITGQTWSSNTRNKHCKTVAMEQHYNVDKAGIWADCIRERRTIIHNAYLDMPFRTRLPRGHAPLTRELVSPVFRQQKIVAVIGIGNKPFDYDADDIALVENFATLIFDIVVRKKADMELCTTRLAVDSASAGIGICNNQGIITYVNLAYLKLFGYSTTDEVIGTHISAHAANPNAPKKIIGSITPTKSVKTQDWMRHRDGKKFFAEISLNYFQNDINGQSGYMASFIDISDKLKTQTALRQSEERFRTIATTSNDIFYEIDLKTRRIYWHGNTRAIWDGLELPKTVEEYQQYFNPDDLARHNTRVAEAYHNKSAWKTEYELRLPGKKPIFFKGRGFAEYTGNTPVKAYGTLTDVTYEKKMYDELKVARIKAEESNHLKTAFLTTMSHELRTPLNHIMGFSQLLMDETNVVEAQQYAHDIYKSGNHLLNIIEDILNISTLQQQHVQVHHEKVLMLDLFSMLKNNFSTIFSNFSLNSENIQLVYLPDKSLFEEYFYTDRIKLIQILGNIFDNAMKFTKEGEIKFGFKKHNGSHIQFYIEDTGIGISPENQLKIFDKFRQIEDGATRQYSGIGVGLTIAQILTKALGGSIHLRSTQGKGSTFCVNLPFQKNQNVL